VVVISKGRVQCKKNVPLFFDFLSLSLFKNSSKSSTEVAVEMPGSFGGVAQ